MLKVAVIITLVDPADRTPGCLEECQKQVEAIQAEEKYTFSIFMNTAGEAGRKGIWKQASREGCDFYLWIDRDLVLAEDAIRVFLENSEFLRHRVIIAGTVSGPDGSTLLFGGRSRHGRILPPDPTIPVPCHLFDNDLALIPAYAFSQLEDPEEMFHRSIIEYGCGAKAAKAGVARVIAPGILAQTSRKIEIPVWKNPEYSLAERALALFRSARHEFMRILHSSFR